VAYASCLHKFFTAAEYSPEWSDRYQNWKDLGKGEVQFTLFRFFNSSPDFEQESNTVWSWELSVRGNWVARLRLCEQVLQRTPAERRKRTDQRHLQRVVAAHYRMGSLLIRWVQGFTICLAASDQEPRVLWSNPNRRDDWESLTWARLLRSSNSVLIATMHNASRLCALLETNLESQENKPKDHAEQQAIQSFCVRFKPLVCWKGTKHAWSLQMETQFW